MSYKRLTETKKINEYCSTAECGEHCEDCYVGNLYERLALLEDKIENGTLVELPCRVGDKVYFPVDNGWDYAEIDKIDIFEKDIVFEWVQYDRGYELTELWDEGDFSIHDIGKTVFLTRAEAEKKLQELKEQENGIQQKAD